MEWSRIFKIILALGISTAISGAFYVYDLQGSRLDRSELALKSARQAAYFIDEIGAHLPPTTDKQERAKTALSTVSRGIDTQWMQLELIQDASLQPGLEKYDLNVKEGVYEYTKNLEWADASSVRVRVQLGYSGFLGAKIKWVSDLLIGILWVLFWITFLTLIESGEPKRGEQSAPVRQPESQLLDMELPLLRVGKSVKVLAEKANELLEISGRSASLKPAGQALSRAITDLMGALRTASLVLKKGKRPPGK